MYRVFLQEAKEYREQLIACRRRLHTCAETGFDLPRTAAVIAETLADLGCKPKTIGRCGLTATIGNGSPTVLLRADMDALPMKEKAAVPFACKEGNMHACGHDMHCAMLLGAAAILKRHAMELNGCIKLMFQPAEELLEGAADMLAHGLLENDQKCVSLMLHVMSATGLKTGTIVVPDGGVSAPAADMFCITVRGKECHGAMPHMGIDPINAAAHILLALQTISTREMGIGDGHALTIASFHGGETANAIPGEAILHGSVRSYDVKMQQFLRERIKAIAETTASAFRAAAQINWLSACPPLLNDQRLVERAEKILPSVIGKEYVLTARKLKGEGARSVGSEDFAYISQRIPSLMLAIAAGGEQPLHHPEVVFDEDALPYGAAVYAAFAAAMVSAGK